MQLPQKLDVVNFKDYKMQDTHKVYVLTSVRQNVTIEKLCGKITSYRTVFQTSFTNFISPFGKLYVSNFDARRLSLSQLQFMVWLAAFHFCRSKFLTSAYLMNCLISSRRDLPLTFTLITIPSILYSVTHLKNKRQQNTHTQHNITRIFINQLGWNKPDVRRKEVGLLKTTHPFY